MIRVGRDVSSARLLELIPVHTAIRMIGIRRMKSPLDQARRFDHKIQKAGKGFCHFRISILAWHGVEEVGGLLRSLSPKPPGLLNGRDVFECEVA